jgi:CNT family concentrative nucleoside transporter
MIERLTSAGGVLCMLLAAFACCPRALRSKVDRRTVLGGLGLLVLISLLVLRTPLAGLFGYANGGVNDLLGFTREGARFVFGALAVDSNTFGYVFAFQVLPTILFFSALMSVLYHLGVMPWIIERGGRFLSRALRVSGAESFSTVADVFVGQTEAPLAVRPYVARMTLSELNACMVAGFATTAGGVLAAYVAMLSASIPGIAGHLLACSVMSAPASLVIAKLMLPEADVPETGSDLRAERERPSVNVFGIELGLTRILSWVFTPLAFLLGLPVGDVAKVGGLLGQKTVFNEFVAYSYMSEMLSQDPAWLSERGRVITSYALCGFANFGSIGIQIAGYSSLAPERLGDLSRLGPRAMLGGLLTTCLVACVAGVVL